MIKDVIWILGAILICVLGWMWLLFCGQYANAHTQEEAQVQNLAEDKIWLQPAPPLIQQTKWYDPNGGLIGVYYTELDPNYFWVMTRQDDGMGGHVVRSVGYSIANYKEIVK